MVAVERDLLVYINTRVALTKEARIRYLVRLSYSFQVKVFIAIIDHHTQVFSDLLYFAKLKLFGT